MMNRICVKKILAVIVILLFIGVSVVPSTGTVIDKKFSRPTFYDGNTLYVDGTGSGNYTSLDIVITNIDANNPNVICKVMFIMKYDIVDSHSSK